jgi:hypothetical protein
MREARRLKQASLFLEFGLGFGLRKGLGLRLGLGF